MNVADDLELVQFVSERTDHSLSVELRYFHALKMFRDRCRELADTLKVVADEPDLERRRAMVQSVLGARKH